MPEDLEVFLVKVYIVVSRFNHEKNSLQQFCKELFWALHPPVLISLFLIV